MFGLFNTRSRLNLGLQVANLAALSLATYDLITNPQSKLSELGLDIVVHAANFLCLSENADALSGFLVSQLNVLRVGSIYAGVTSGCTGVPLLLNGVDAANHLLTGGTLLFGNDDELAANSQRPAK